MKSVLKALLAAFVIQPVSATVGIVTYFSNFREVIFVDGNGTPRVDGIGRTRVFQTHANRGELFDLQDSDGVTFEATCDANSMVYPTQPYMGYCLDANDAWTFASMHFGTYTVFYVYNNLESVFPYSQVETLETFDWEQTPSFSGSFYWW